MGYPGPPGDTQGGPRRRQRHQGLPQASPGGARAAADDDWEPGVQRCSKDVQSCSKLFKGDQVGRIGAPQGFHWAQGCLNLFST